MPNNSDLGARIRRARRTRDLTQAALAERVGVHLSRVAEWERGQHTPGSGAITKLAAALSLTTDQLLNGKPANSSGDDDTRQIALDALALSGRLNTFAQALLAAGGQPERAEPTPPTLQRAPVAPVDRHHPARTPDEVATAADAGKGPGRRRRGA